MTEEKKKEIWTIDELVELTEKVQTDSVTYLEKELPIQWCDLVESEEPKGTRVILTIPIIKS